MTAKPLPFATLMLAASVVGHARADEKQARYVQLAELDIDPAQLESYEAAAKEQIENGDAVEPGVLALYCVADKNNSSHIGVFEMYRDIDAYKKHLRRDQSGGISRGGRCQRRPESSIRAMQRPARLPRSL